MKYGWHGIFALTAALEDDRNTRAYQEYTADVQNAIASGLYKYFGGSISLPSLREIWYPEEKPKEDDRTGREIVDRLIDRLTK